MDRILIILKKENRSRASSALTLGLNTIILKHVYWYVVIRVVSKKGRWTSLNMPCIVVFACYCFPMLLVLYSLGFNKFDLNKI